MLFQNSIGIDIEDDRVSIVHLRASLKGILLAGYHTQPLDPDSDISQRMQETARVVEAFLQRRGVKTTEIFIGVPNGLVFQRVVELPAAAAENIVQTLAYELDKYVPVPSSDVYLDAQVVSDDRKQGSVKALLIVARKEALDPYISFGRDVAEGAAGIELRGTAQANYLAFHSESVREAPYAYAMRKGDTYEIGLLIDGKPLFLRETQAGEGLDSALKALKQEVQQSGGLSNEGGKNLQVAVAETDFEMAAEFGADAGDDQLDVSRIPAAIPPVEHFSAAYGLALKGLRNTGTQINLMPFNYRKKPNKLVYYTMLGLAFGVLLMAFFWGAGHVLQQRMQVQRIDDRLASMGEEVSRVNELEAEIGTLEEQIDRLVSIRQDYTPVLSVLNELTEVIPQDAYIDSFSLSGKTVQITGTAVSASDLLTGLEDSPLFHEVAFLATITKDKQGKDKFRIGFSAGE